MLINYRVTTTHITLNVMAYSLAHAITVGLELAGPRAVLLSCIREGEW